MPKKTKRQKLLAAYRKKLRQIEQLTARPAPPAVSAPPVTKTVPTVSVNVVKSDAGESLPFDQFFFQDLRKCVFLIGAIILVEFALYFGTMKGIINF
ncbi:hypothetical protein M1523_00430 [Patescibacteria group bacterium]|nr:hypothetical protein [Patescibacteria group bacterium]MCL5091627.1 hypothetical protein [Patescibacteria group bacterium]